MTPAGATALAARRINRHACASKFGAHGRHRHGAGRKISEIRSVRFHTALPGAHLIHTAPAANEWRPALSNRLSGSRSIVGVAGRYIPSRKRTTMIWELITVLHLQAGLAIAHDKPRVVAQYSDKASCEQAKVHLIGAAPIPRGYVAAWNDPVCRNQKQAGTAHSSGASQINASGK